MILPDGYSDVPAGKIAAVVTHLEMTERPALRSDPEGAWMAAYGLSEGGAPSKERFASARAS